MATLKHISSKNSDYTAIEAYLVYQHDAFTGKQLLDEHGKPKLRESYILDTLECGDFSFATACLLANRKYGKNTQHGDIKSHQYIISFDPRDAADNGLTMEKAQALGLKFCSENFPGHPAIVASLAQLPNYHRPTFFQSAQWEHLLYLALSVSDQQSEAAACQHLSSDLLGAVERFHGNAEIHPYRPLHHVCA